MNFDLWEDELTVYNGYEPDDSEVFMLIQNENDKYTMFLDNKWEAKIVDIEGKMCVSIKKKSYSNSTLRKKPKVLDMNEVLKCKHRKQNNERYCCKCGVPLRYEKYKWVVDDEAIEEYPKMG